MKIVVPVVIIPDKGTTIWELSGEILEARKQGKIGEIVFVELPDGKQIKVSGETRDFIRDSIATQSGMYVKF